MPTFKRIFSTLWYGWHLSDLGRLLFLFVFGVFFLFGAAYYASRDRLPHTPRPVDLAEAHRLVAGSEPCYVRLSARPDIPRRIFRTGAWAPFWGNCPPGETRSIRPAHANEGNMAGMLGCRVSFEGRMDLGEVRTVWYPPHQAGKEARVVSLGPVMGSEGRLWVRSELARGAGPDLSGWKEGQAFSGVLARWDQALAGLPKGLAGQAKRTLPSLPGAFVIVPKKAYTGEALDFFTRHFWVPVKGSDRLFLWTDEKAMSRAGDTITGVIEPLSPNDHLALDRSFAHFETVTDRPLPERFGVIRYPTARAYNDKLSGYSGIFLIFGVLWTLCGLGGIILYIKAPDLIYGAWKRAFINLGLIRSPGKEARRAGPQEPAEADSGAPHPLEAPFSSLPPIEGQPRPRPSMDAAFRALRSFEPSRGERYCVFVQDFSHPNNPDTGLRLIACCEDPDEAGKALLNSGQRHPGLVLLLLAVNAGPFSGARQRNPQALDAFTMLAGDFVVLGHAPSSRLIQRTVICGVFDGSEPEAPASARAALVGRQEFALLGKAIMIGDSENGPCQAMSKTRGSSLLRAGAKGR